MAASIASAGDVEVVVLAVPDPVGVGVDEPGVGDVLADIDDRHLITGEPPGPPPGCRRDDGPVLDE